MRATRCLAYGPPETLVIEEMPSVALEPGQVRVQVHAASVNYPDVLIMANLGSSRPEESRPEALTEPCVNLSTHTALTIRLHEE